VTNYPIKCSLKILAAIFGIFRWQLKFARLKNVKNANTKKGILYFLSWNSAFFFQLNFPVTKTLPGITVLNLTFELMRLSECVCQSYPWHTLCEMCVYRGIHDSTASVLFTPWAMRWMRSMRSLLWWMSSMFCSSWCKITFEHYTRNWKF